MSYLIEQLEEATARIASVIWIQAACIDCTLTAPLRDLLDDADEATLRRCFADMPSGLIDDLLSRADAEIAREFAAEWLVQNKPGFLIEVETPVMTHSATGSRYSWGYRRCAWVYGDTLDLAVLAGLAWVQGMRQIEISKTKGPSETGAQKVPKELR